MWDNIRNIHKKKAVGMIMAKKFGRLQIMRYKAKTKIIFVSVLFSPTIQ